MASVFRIPRSPFWFAAYRTADGRRVQRTTKQRSRKAALETALGWERLEDAGRRRTLTESNARRVVAEIVERSIGEQMQFYTCRAWLEEWVAGKMGAAGERSVLKYKQITRDFLKHLGDRADLPVQAISSRDVRGFRDALRSGGHSASTINQTRKILTSPFEAARRLGYIEVNPCAGVEALLDTKDEKDVFTSDQVAELLKKAEGDWEGLILAGFFTGQRLKHLSTLTWGAVDFETKVIRFTSENRHKRAGKVVPIHPDLLAWLQKQTRGIGKAPVFPTLANKSGTGKSGLSMTFRKIMEAAGLTGRTLREAKGAGRKVSSLTFHSLRHACNSGMLNAGVSQEVRMKITGHASKAVNDRYSHAEIDTLRAAVSLLPSLTSGEAKR